MCTLGLFSVSVCFSEYEIMVIHNVALASTHRGGQIEPGCTELHYFYFLGFFIEWFYETADLPIAILAEGLSLKTVLGYDRRQNPMLQILIAAVAKKSN